MNDETPQRPEKHVTLKTIAARANVTCALVSLALRNSPKVAKATRIRLKKIADELGYKPSPMVRALMTHIRHGRKVHYRSTLAFVTNLRSADYWRTLPTYPEYFRGASRRATVSGYTLEHFWLGKYAENPSRFIKVLKARGIPGVIIAPLPHGSTSLGVDLSGFSVVTFGYSFASPHIPRICNNHLQTIEHAIQHLAERGYRRIGVALGARDIRQVNHLWLAGLTVARSKFPDLDIHSFEPKAWSEKNFQSWFKKLRPQVIVGVTMELWQWTKNLGPSIPGELGFFHLDCWKGDGISGMYQRTDRLGEVAMETLIAFVEQNVQLQDEESRILLLNSEFHAGKTILPNILTI